MLEFLYYFMYTELVNSCENFLEKHIILCKIRLSLMTSEVGITRALGRTDPLLCYVL